MSPPRCWCELCKRKGRKENRAKRGEMYWEFVGLGGGWVVASIYEPGAESESFLLLVFAVEGKGEGWESGGWYRFGFTSFLAILMIWDMHAGLWLRGFMLAGAGRRKEKHDQDRVQIRTNTYNLSGFFFYQTGYVWFSLCAAGVIFSKVLDLNP